MTQRIRYVERVKVTWCRIAIDITFEREWLSLPQDALRVSHLTVTSAGCRPLPFTDTGFRSRFLSPALVDDAGGPAAYVLVWLEETGRSAKWREQAASEAQLSLF